MVAAADAAGNLIPSMNIKSPRNVLRGDFLTCYGSKNLLFTIRVRIASDLIEALRQPHQSKAKRVELIAKPLQVVVRLAFVH